MEPRIIQLPKHVDLRGNLSAIEECKEVPFHIARTYWIYDVPGGETRGGHAYIQNEELIIALSGSFDVLLDDGNGERCFSLNRSYYGLYVPKGWWRSMNNFSTNSVALVLASIPYTPEDYIYDYEVFRSFCRSSGVQEFRSSDNCQHAENEESPHTIGSQANDSSSFLHSSLKEKASVYDCPLIPLPKVEIREGNITALNGGIDLPFDIKRVFYTYDIPGGVTRGGHVHLQCHELLVAASGSFEVVLDDGTNRRIVTLNRPYYGLHILPGIWSAEQEFSSGSICLALTSDTYDDSDYIRDYEEYKRQR
ncbi:MAG: WxcM-like domain-containing protein [Prevotella sp.]|nr:WxcM-like domain-containing protein [Prevotella sp.]